MKKIFSLTLLFCLTLGLFTACTPRYYGVDGSSLEPFVIGTIGRQTGHLGRFGLSVQRGAQIAADEINATGGVNGFRLVINAQDSKGDPQVISSVFQKLLDNDMEVLLGGVFSDETEALLEATAENKILMISPSDSALRTEDAKGNLFRLCYDNRTIAAAVANFLNENALQRKIAVLWSDDLFGGKEISQALAEDCATKGIAVTQYQLPSDTLRPNYEKVINEVRESGVTDVVLALSPSVGAAYLAQAKKFDTTRKTYYGCGGMDMLLSGQMETYEGLLLFSAFAPSENGLTESFSDAYRTAYNEEPDRYAAEAYDTVYAIAEAIKKAGLRPQNRTEDTFRDKLLSAMTRIQVKGVTGTTSWTADGESTRPVKIMVIRDGKILPLGSEETRK